MEFVDLGLIFFFEHSIYIINDNALLSYSKSELLTIGETSDTIFYYRSLNKRRKYARKKPEDREIAVKLHELDWGYNKKEEKNE